MLKQFEIPQENVVRVDHRRLHETTVALFVRHGVPPADAEIGADTLVRADLRGVDTHGVSNMFPHYLSDFRNGVINPRPELRILRETAATANMHSDDGLGVIVAPKAMELAIEKASNAGVGMVTVGFGRHLGMASYHAMLAMEHDMIGLCVTNAGPRVVPTFGAVPRLGTNPIAMAAPAGAEPPFVFDVATSVVAGNKITIAQRLGTKLAGGWAADIDGTPIMEETAPPPPPSDVAALLPLGSTREMGSHKGFGLGMIVDILSGILAGAGYGMFPGRPYNHHMVAAYRIDAFTDVDGYKAMMDEFLQTLKATPPAPGHERVIVPGEPEWEAEQERRANGIPLHSRGHRLVPRHLQRVGRPLHAGVIFSGMHNLLLWARFPAQFGLD